jgi:hypothetical protein
VSANFAVSAIDARIKNRDRYIPASRLQTKVAANQVSVASRAFNPGVCANFRFCIKGEGAIGVHRTDSRQM